mgnify:CR=1 FL=1
MKKLILILSLFAAFSSFANEEMSGIKIKDGKLVIDLNRIKIEDILLQDGTVIDAQKLEQLKSKLEQFRQVEKVSGGTDSGGG